MNYPILIVGAVVDVQQLTMYRADGETMVMQQGDPRIRDLVAKLATALETWPNQYYLTQEDMAGKNHYAEAEKKTGGLVRFFKVAKTKLKEIAEKFLEPLAPMELGTTPETKAPVHLINGEEAFEEAYPMAGELPKEEHRPLTKSAAAVAEIMANAVTTSDAGFGKVNENQGEEETIVAVTEDNTVIPGVEQISNQMQSVAESVGSGQGMTKFFERAGMIKRGHSVEDLLKFMQKGELPVADDGSVLVYKRLQSIGGDVFVDVHSKRVKQRVGSFVHMAESMVDPDRRQDCSNGLHVARRDYLTAFSGNVTVLAKLAPEDVIAVPQYDARKLRAKGYHIIAVLSDADAKLVNNNKPMQDTKLLADAVAGNHVGILEYVEITEAKGGGLKVTPAKEVVTTPVVDISDRNVQSLDHLPGTSEATSQVDARALALDLAKPGAETTVEVTFKGDSVVSIMEVTPPATVFQSGVVTVPKAKVTVIQRLMDDWMVAATDEEKLSAAQALLHFKKQSKKSWTALGVPAALKIAAINVVAQDAAAASLPKVVPPNDDHMLAKPVKKVVKPVIKPKVKPVEIPTKAPAVAKAPGKRSQKEEAAHLLEIYTRNPDYTNAKQLVAFKRSTKKGWTAIGVDEVLGKKLEARVKV